MKIKFQNRKDNLISNKAQDFGLAANTDYLFGLESLGLYFSSKDYTPCYIRNKSGLYHEKNSESISFIYLIVSGNISLQGHDDIITDVYYGYRKINQ